MNDVSSTVAVYSDTGALIHLYIDGYRTNEKRTHVAMTVKTSEFPTAVCGAAAHTWWPGFPPQIPGHPTGRVWVPLRDALKLERDPDPTMVDPRHPNPSRRRWCPKCVGMALTYAGLGDQALDLLVGSIGGP